MKAALDRLAGLGAEERAVALAELRALDAELAVEAESLLAARLSDSFLQSPAVTAPHVEPGMRVGPYEVLDLLGRGGMGDVWRARDTTLRRDVALKMLPGDVAQDPTRLARLRKEAQVLASLNHPYVGTIYGFEGAGPTPALVLELVQGQTLATRLSHGPLPVRDTLRLAGQIAEALEAAHEHGIVHRDLKPGNVMLRPDGTVKVLDFGLATFGREHTGGAATSLALTQPGTVVGTPAYMAPEQARGETVDHRADIWAFGCVLYEMLTGRSAFGAPTLAESFAKVLDGRVDLDALPGDTPPSIRRLVRRCLDLSLRNRLQHIGDARADVVDALTDSIGGDVTLESALRRTQPPPHGKLYLSVALILVSLVIGTVGALLFLTFGGRDAPGSQLSSQRLTTSGSAELPALSPDGKYVFYVERGKDGDSLWMRQIATTRSRQVVEPQPDIRIVAITVKPDGEFVYFVAGESERSYTLRRVPTIGGPHQVVIDHVDSAISWSPDGSQFVFIRLDRPGVDKTSLMMADANGTNERTLIRQTVPEDTRTFSTLALSGRGTGPAWSPDGATIVVPGITYPDRTGYVMSFTLRDRTLRNVPLTPEGRGGAWADEDTLIWSRAAAVGEPRQLWSMSHPSAQLRPLTTDFGDYGTVSLSEKRDVFVTTRTDRESEIWIRDETGGPGGTLDTSAAAPFAALGGAQLAWAGHRLLYGGSSGDHIGLWEVDTDIDSKNASQELVRNARLPSASADGSVIIFLSDDMKNGLNTLWKAGRDGRAPTLVSRDALWPALTPNGREAVFTRASPAGVVRPYRVNLDGGNPEQIVDKAARNPTISPDGRRLAFLSSEPEPDGRSVNGIYVCDLLNCEASLSFVRPPGLLPGDRAIRWTVDSRDIAYVNATDGPNIWIHPLSDRSRAKPVTDFTDGWNIRSFAWSRDGRLAVLREKVRTDIVQFKFRDR